MDNYVLETKEKTVFCDNVIGKMCSIPSGWSAELIMTPDSPAISSEDEIRKAILEPCCGKSIEEIVSEKNASSAAILVSDATRGIPTEQMLKHVAKALIDAGIPEENITVFVGIGVHRKATEEEMKSIMGDHYGRIQIKNHDPYDEEGLVDLGFTSMGTPVSVNKKAYEKDIHIQIGKVEPHEFAGFSGGRKSVLPGISSEKTIAVNHRPEMILDQKAAIGVLGDNPVHKDMLEAAEFFGVDFGVNCVLNEKMDIAAVYAGDMKESHMAAIENVKDSLGVAVPKADIIVTTPGQPLDIDFYQSVKALIALTEILEPETKVVLYCSCPDGVASEDMLRAFRGGKTIEESVGFTKANYKIQMDHVLLLSKILSKKTEIYVSCENVSDKDIEDMFMIPHEDPDSALAAAAASTGKDSGHIVFYPRPQTGLAVKRED